MRTNRWLLLIILLAAMYLLPLFCGPYYLKFATRILIYGLAAVALDLVVGFGGLISFGHAAFFGIGAYVAGILALSSITSAFIVWPLAMIVAGTIAGAIGMLSLRTSGIYFIFITLAFAQTIFYVAQSLRQYGGDDGFSLAAPTSFGFGFASNSPTSLFYFVLTLTCIVVFLCFRLVTSRFGQVVQAARDNRRRAQALGINVYPYQVVVFAISGAIAGLAGALDAALTAYITPASMSWIVSGDLLMMVILGSAGTLIGPILGAAMFIAFEQILSDMTPHWMLGLGAILVARVLFLRDGLFGLMGGRMRWMSAS